MKSWGRIITAMVTPFTGDGEVDYKRAGQLAEHLVKNGSDAVLVCATTGEAPTLSTEEKLHLFEVVKEKIGNKPMLCGTGTNSTKATLELSKLAKERGADGLLIVTPYYNKPPQDCIVKHFQAVAEAVDLPIIAYNIPGRTGTEIKPRTLAEIASIPNVVAVKESLPHIDSISELSHLVQDNNNFSIYSGDDSSFLPTLAVGGVGVVSVSSHVAGNLMKEMAEDFFAGKVAEATKLHLRLYPLFTGLFAVTNPILIKAALKLQGFDVGGLRMPLREASGQEVEALEKIMRQVGIL